MTGRCPFAEWHPIPGHDDAGPMTGGASKIAHHSTEGESLAGAVATYAKTGDLPHFTDTFEGGVYRVVQHLPLDVAATALKHPAGTGDTNRDNVIQIEHVGHAATSSSWPTGYLDEIGILCRWIEAQTGCVRAAVAPFTPGARRLSWPEWHGTSGHLGHMHVPFNDHTDPGAMDIGRVLTAGQQPAPAPAPPLPAPPVPPLALPGDDDMPLQLLTINAGPLGQHGEGAMLFDGGPPGGGIAHNVPIRWEQCRGVEVQGSFPPDDGYWPLPKVGRQERGGWLCVELVDGAPGQNPVNLLITVAA